MTPPASRAPVLTTLLACLVLLPSCALQAKLSFKCAAAPFSLRKGDTKEDKKLRDDENEPNRRVEINLYPDDTIRCYVPPPQQPWLRG